MAVFHDPESFRIKYLFSRLKIYLLCLVCFYLSFFICSPYNFLDPLGRQITFGSIYSFSTQISVIMQKTDNNEQVAEDMEQLEEEKEDPVGYIERVSEYVTTLSRGFGIIILLICLSGLCYMTAFFDKKVFFCYFFPVLFAGIALAIRSSHNEIRHQIVIYPFLAIAGGLIFAKCMDVFSNKGSILKYVVILLLAVPLVQVARYDMLITRADTRQIAGEWIEKNIAPGAKLLLTENGVQLKESPESLRGMLSKAEKADPKGQFTAHYGKLLRYKMKAFEKGISYDISYIRFPWWRKKEIKKGIHYLDSEYDKDMGTYLKPVGVENYEYYVKEGFEYAIVGGNKYERFLEDSTDSRNFPSFREFYRELFQKGRIIKKILPDEGVRRPGPKIMIFSFKPPAGG